MEDQHKLIKGYRDLDQETINAINKVKECERSVAAEWRALKALEDTLAQGLDMRWMAVAKTHFDQGFMAFARAIAQPEDPYK